VIVTDGASGALTVSSTVPCPVEPLLSTAVTVIVKLPPELYTWVSEVEDPSRVSAELPSAQLTVTVDIVPSGSLVEKFTVTVWPARAGFGETLETLTVGGRSFTVTEPVP